MQSSSNRDDLRISSLASGDNHHSFGLPRTEDKEKNAPSSSIPFCCYYPFSINATPCLPCLTRGMPGRHEQIMVGRSLGAVPLFSNASQPVPIGPEPSELMKRVEHRLSLFWVFHAFIVRTIQPFSVLFVPHVFLSHRTKSQVGRVITEEVSWWWSHRQTGLTLCSPVCGTVEREKGRGQLDSGFEQPLHIALRRITSDPGALDMKTVLIFQSLESYQTNMQRKLENLRYSPQSQPTRYRCLHRRETRDFYQRPLPNSRLNHGWIHAHLGTESGRSR
ncbi:hypothetical protein QBC35DRAFT_10434 [Podospora australis]|uniref:Uncharacterized protein n=1 Tax=Podospora australis TaxID=1536484 RepID=A0AAN7AP59_9PEZI|nr:hypothetical protein QBC35DRAFT_10434 [Podospora australis]